ncbi:MAG: hypothetical protein ACRYGL_07620 [Janthinobacterium lividum]
MSDFVDAGMMPLVTKRQRKAIFTLSAKIAVFRQYIPIMLIKPGAPALTFSPQSSADHRRAGRWKTNIIKHARAWHAAMQNLRTVCKRIQATRHYRFSR